MTHLPSLLLLLSAGNYGAAMVSIYFRSARGVYGFNAAAVLCFVAAFIVNHYVCVRPMVAGWRR